MYSLTIKGESQSHNLVPEKPQNEVFLIFLLLVIVFALSIPYNNYLKEGKIYFFFFHRVTTQCVSLLTSFFYIFVTTKCISLFFAIIYVSFLYCISHSSLLMNKK